MADKPKTVRVRLKKAHVHAGVRRKAGTVIQASPAAADWLVRHGVGERVKEN